MAERRVEELEDEVPEIPEILEQVLLHCLDEGKRRLQDHGELVPLTAIAVGEDLYIETHPADTIEECFELARSTVEEISGADAYGLCYDGYIDTDEGGMDAVIAEGGVPGEENGFAVCYLYEGTEEGSPDFEPEPAYVGYAPNYMRKTPRPASDDLAE